ncbi:Fasciclin-domain-containing protein [Lojkania enalia]|uniref:Fasciclin-domain-containing protein n=1 Tax=Lojkania enalia TaxID=147567 RepID=A0A9P4KCY2_9PLEO|nr:Fasciclin-domain-containing protein [Didymosphaeria enalia]
MQFKHIPLLTLASYVAAQASNNTLNATLSGNPDLSNLTSFISVSPGLLQQLSNAQNITILAPSDKAFEELLNSPTSEMLNEDPGLLSALLQYHILNGTYMADQISNMSAFIPTMLMNGSYSNVTGGQVVEAVQVGNETVFYSGLLRNTTVQEADLNFNGGVIHVIDSVLTLPLSVLDTLNIADLTALRGAVNTTDSISAVNDTPDLTIFAPTNEAFQSIGSALQNLTDEDLANILSYHVVNSTVGYSTDLENGTSLQTIQGSNVTITIDTNGTVFVNAARVVTPNILVANGVVHIIDNVLNPMATSGPTPSATSGAPGFTDASSVSDVPYTSDQPTPTTTMNPTEDGAGPATSSTTGGAVPMRTAVMGMGALFGGAAVLMI